MPPLLEGRVRLPEPTVWGYRQAVCVSVCLCVCVYKSMRDCLCVYVSFKNLVYIQSRKHTHAHAHAHAHAQTPTPSFPPPPHTHTYTHACAYSYTYTHLNTYKPFDCFIIGAGSAAAAASNCCSQCPSIFHTHTNTPALPAPPQGKAQQQLSPAVAHHGH